MSELEGIPVISLWQPWAQWVALEWKLIESRLHNRFKSLEGKRIGIHASRKWDNDWNLIAGQFLSCDQKLRTLEFKRILYPSVICTAFVSSYGSLSPDEARWAKIECFTPRMGLWLRDIQLLDIPIECRGRQGIFYIERV